MVMVRRGLVWYHDVKWKILIRAEMLLLEKCNDNKKVYATLQLGDLC